MNKGEECLEITAQNCCSYKAKFHYSILFLTCKSISISLSPVTIAVFFILKKNIQFNKKAAVQTSVNMKEKEIKPVSGEKLKFLYQSTKMSG